MTPTRVVCVHSLTAHGVVGLKAFIPVLGEHCLPVPSLLLSGPGDMPGCARFAVDTAGLLRCALQAGAVRQEPIALFVGYMTSVAQIEAIAAIIAEYRAALAAVCVDPVCGDDDRAYVAAEIIAAWPRLIAQADWLFPNRTEAALLTGRRDDAAIAALTELAPKAHIVLTGIAVEGDIETRLYRGSLLATSRQPRLGGRFNGAGDLFAAYFLRAIFVEGATPSVALGLAAEGVSRAIQLALARGESDLSVRATL